MPLIREIFRHKGVGLGRDVPKARGELEAHLLYPPVLREKGIPPPLSESCSSQN